MATAVTGSIAPRMATGVLPILWMAALVQMSEIAVGNKAMEKAESHSQGFEESMANVSVRKRKAKSNSPKAMT